MKSHKKIIQELLHNIDSEQLSKLLQQALRLAQKLGDADFERWVRLELNGYFNTNPALTEETVVPTYRTIGGQHSDEYGRPLVIEDPKLALINETRLRFGVIELEQMQNHQGMLYYRDPSASKIIKQHLNVIVSKFSFNPKQISGILSSIRTQLSDYLIKLEAKFKTKSIDKETEDLILTNEEVLELRPNIYGIGIDLKVLAKKCYRYIKQLKNRMF